MQLAGAGPGLAWHGQARIEMSQLGGMALPVGGELSDELAEAVGGGQPLVLTWRRQPAAVVLDVESRSGTTVNMTRPGWRGGAIG